MSAPAVTPERGIGQLFDSRMGERAARLRLVADWLRRAADGEPGQVICPCKLRRAAIRVRCAADRVSENGGAAYDWQYGRTAEDPAPRVRAILADVADGLKPIAKKLAREAAGPLNFVDVEATESLWGVVELLEEFTDGRVLERDVEELLRGSD